ncbi:NHLM bacteriocin system ABC transporter ATP-binding protein [Humitalea rosea]|uniref:NHLM bacteriocin system ABC transporter ATP-binding protein n=1 Tax=Humitalea rosea TaxID=990373 RepID=A0A2W7IMC0_9PROT|nr:ATP-binding cassette domain-containing protein [Humitalea rosea]PZW46985.1 NHLM bacteriocin system ABC transporter ATP-binding protein [Humitalea rosea]
MMDGTQLPPPGPSQVMLPPGHVLSLDAGPRAWKVEAGRMEVYAVCGGMRRFLGECAVGTWIFASDRTPGRMIAMSPEGARLRAVEMEGIDPTDAIGIGAMEQWIHQLSDGLTKHAPVRPAITPLLPGDAPRLAAGEAVAAVRGVVWLASPDAAGARFMGAAPQPAPLLLPLTPASWLVFEAPCAPEALDTAACLARHDPAGLFGGLADAIAASLIAWQEEAAARRLLRLEALRTTTGERLDAARGRFAAVLQPGAGPVSTSGDEVAHVLQLIVPLGEGPPPKTDKGATLREAAELRGLLIREVTLNGDWSRRDLGPLIARRSADGRLAALLPDWRGRYRVHVLGEPIVRLSARLAEGFDREATIVAAPMPNRAVRARELIGLCFAAARLDFLTLALATLATSLLGLALPLATQQVVDVFIPDRLLAPLAGFGVALLVLTLCTTFLRVTTDVARARLDTRISAAIQTGVMDRMLRMPATLLRSTTSVDLARQVLSVDQVRRSLLQTALGTGLSGVFGLSGLVVLAFYSPLAAAIAFGLFVALIVLSVITGIRQHRGLMRGEAMESDVTSFTLQVVQNVATLRCFGAERRAWAMWANDAARTRSRGLVSRSAYVTFDACVTSYDLVALALIFAVLGNLGGETLSTGAYIAFVVTYQGFLMASEALARAVVQTAAQLPAIKRAQKVLATAPENPPMRKAPGVISGLVEISNVTFSYSPEQRVLNGVTLRIEAGQSVAFVGPSGCGKSTLLNIVLGLDNPSGGMVLYDRQDLAKLDRRLLRRQIGVVRQNGRLLSGTIFDNIVGLHRGTMEEAWTAAEQAAVADDIRALPMGMHTMLNEGTSTFSGGQVQRMLIARALAGKPKLLVLDEATSALDNVTQAAVTRSLDRLGITRIIVAHRLSTLLHADTIYFLDQGQIAEAGSADQLVAAGGRFAEFMRRQAL